MGDKLLRFGAGAAAGGGGEGDEEEVMILCVERERGIVRVTTHYYKLATTLLPFSVYVSYIAS